MDDLTQAGIVKRIQGKGTFVSMDKPQKPRSDRKLNTYALALPEVRSGVYPPLIKGFEQGASPAGRAARYWG